MKKHKTFFLLFFGIVLSVKAQSSEVFFSKTDEFLKTVVEEGRVDYQALKKDASKLNALLELADTIEISKQSKDEYQAFWINSYNLWVIKSVVENYPLKSPLEVSGFFETIKHKVGGLNITLNDMENKLLRGNFPDEPRFHFVLVCAGLGCPPIINEAYCPDTLDAQLSTQTKIALNDPNFIQVSKNKVRVSQIFEWYNGDFVKNGDTLIDFINGYRAEPLLEKTKIEYYPYDWTLNGQN
ncbi:MAG: DUF547 domain-containing protein [Flavobacteriaceae bacterium]